MLETKPIFKEIVKGVAIITVACFLWQDFVFAQGGTPIWPQAKAKDINAARGHRIDTITVPHDIGVKRSSSPEASEEIIINIQDAHSSLGAQKSIAGMIESLVKNYGLDLVGLEGSAGRIDTSLVSSFPIENIRKQAAEALLRDTKISASEFYKMVSDEKIELYGIEDLGLYERNIESFRELLSHQQKIQKELAGLDEVLQALEERVFPEDVRWMNRNSLFYDRHSLRHSAAFVAAAEPSVATGSRQPMASPPGRQGRSSDRIIGR